MPVILATQEAEIGRIAVEASLGKKFSRPYLNQLKKKIVIVVCACHPSYIGSVNRMVVQASLGIKTRPN
jgi:hypothetical protein